jgi:hypothetical protein
MSVIFRKDIPSKWRRSSSNLGVVFKTKRVFFSTIYISNYATTALLCQYLVPRGSSSCLLFSLNLHRKAQSFVSSHLLGVFCLNKLEIDADIYSTQRCGVTFAKDLLARRALAPLWGVACNVGLWLCICGGKYVP